MNNLIKALAISLSAVVMWGIMLWGLSVIVCAGGLPILGSVILFSFLTGLVYIALIAEK